MSEPKCPGCKERDERNKWLEAVHGSSPSEVCRTHHVQNCHYCDDLGCGDNTSEAARRLAALEERIKELKEEHRAYEHYVMLGRDQQHEALVHERDQLRADLAAVAPVVRAAISWEDDENECTAAWLMRHVRALPADVRERLMALERMGLEEKR